MIETRANLSDLALRAAIQLHQLQNDDAYESNDVTRFFDAIRSQTSSDGETVLLRDESLFPVYSYALMGNETEVGEKTGVLARLRVLLGDQYEKNSDKGTLENAEHFCLSLHEALVSDLLDDRNIYSRRGDRSK